MLCLYDTRRLVIFSTLTKSVITGERMAQQAAQVKFTVLTTLLQVIMAVLYGVMVR